MLLAVSFIVIILNQFKMSEMDTVVKAADSHLCGWSSIPGKASVFIASLSKCLPLCFLCFDRHVCKLPDFLLCVLCYWITFIKQHRWTASAYRHMHMYAHDAHVCICINMYAHPLPKFQHTQQLIVFWKLDNISNYYILAIIIKTTTLFFKKNSVVQ